MKKILFILMLLKVGICLANQDKSWQELNGPFFGQKHKESGVELFMPGLISIEPMEGHLAFLNNGKVCIFSNERDGILYTFEKNGIWTTPQRAPLVYEDNEYGYNAGPKGENLYFTSGRPTSDGDPKTDFNIWVLPWERETWGKPYPLPFPPNTRGQDEQHPTLTNNGTIYYFIHDIAGLKASKIYRRKWLNGKYGQEEELGWPINSGWDDFDPVVASDESFMLLSSRRPGSFGKDDIYVCFMRNDGKWSDPVNLGEPYNTRDYEHRIGLVPGGRYFFFGSGRDNSTLKKQIAGKPGGRVDGVYWVETSFLKKLKQFIQSRSSAAEIIEKVYQEKGISAVVKEFVELYAGKTRSYYFLPYQLLNICEKMITAGKYNDADKLYQALCNTLPEKFRVKRGFALINITNNQIVKGFNLLKKVMADSPRYFKTDLYLRARDFIWDSRSHDAIEFLKLSIKEFPDWAYASYLLGQSYEKTGDLNKAINYLKNTLKLEPDFREAEKVSEKIKDLEKKRKNHPANAFPVLKGPCLGQKPPGKTPEIFAPGIISTRMSETCPAFTPDGKEFYYKIGGAPHGVILFMIQTGERWSKPETTSLIKKGDAPFFSPDGKRFYFIAFLGKGKWGREAISFMEKRPSGWSESKFLPDIINSNPGIHFAFSVDLKGNLYFGARQKGTVVSRIYFSVHLNGIYSKPIIMEHLKDIDAISPYISPDGKYLIFTSIDSGLMVSFRKKDGGWTDGQLITESNEYPDRCPIVSRDGKFLFYLRSIDARYIPYWMSAKIIEELKPKNLK